MKRRERMAITQEQVSEAADSLVATNERPTVARIRVVLGNTGSPNTIVKFLHVWKQSAPVVQKEERLELSEQLTTSIAQEIQMRMASAKTNIERELVEAKQETAELVTACDQNDEERDVLASKNATLNDENNRHSALSEERAAEIKDLKEALKREQEAAQSAVVREARALNKNETLVENLKQMQTKIDARDMKVETLTEAKVEAEKQAAVLQMQAEQLERQMQQQVVTSAEQKMELNGQLELAEIEKGKLVKRLETQIEELKADFKQRLKFSEAQVVAFTEKLEKKPAAPTTRTIKAK